MSTIIIGGGGIGTTLAYRLAQAGEEVTLLEAGDLADATTAASFSMHIATRKTPKAHFDLAVEGGLEHQRLAADLGIEPGSEESWIHPCACYEWPISDYEDKLIAERVTRLVDWGYTARWITPAELLEREPHLKPGPEVKRVALYDDEAWYDAPRFAALAAHGAVERGAKVVTRERVNAIHRNGGEVVVETDSGTTYAAGRVVVAAGAGARAVASLAGLELQVNTVRGYVVTTDPVPEGTLSGILLHPEINIRPAPGGRIAFHSYLEEGRLPKDLTNDPDHPVAVKVSELAAAVLPALTGAERRTARVGDRPVPADGMPIVGWLDEERSVYSVAAHSGVNFAPVLAKLVCQELTEAPSPQLEAFRPGRDSLVDPNAHEVDESTREMHRMFVESAG